jgi:hypothetical protein
MNGKRHEEHSGMGVIGGKRREQPLNAPERAIRKGYLI